VFFNHLCIDCLREFWSGLYRFLDLSDLHETPQITIRNTLLHFLILTRKLKKTQPKIRRKTMETRSETTTKKTSIFDAKIV